MGRRRRWSSGISTQSRGTGSVSPIPRALSKGRSVVHHPDPGSWSCQRRPPEGKGPLWTMGPGPCRLAACWPRTAATISVGALARGPAPRLGSRQALTHSSAEAKLLALP